MCNSERACSHQTAVRTRSLPQVPLSDTHTRRTLLPVDRPRVELTRSQEPRTSGDDDGLLARADHWFRGSVAKYLSTKLLKYILKYFFKST